MPSSVTLAEPESASPSATAKPSSTAGVEFQKVSKRYGAVSVIEGMDLVIHQGEFMVLVGPSGCGKSTALRMIAGLEAITDGTVLIHGRKVNELPPKARDVAMVFQNYALYPQMTVRQNIEFGLKIRQMPAPEREKAVKEAAAVLEIEKLLERKPKELSGGQRQRVALGRAIVRKPSVFLFDEPLSNLDAKLRVQMRAEIKRLQARLGVTTIYVTHDQVEAMTMGNRIAVMKDGFLQQVGTPIEVYDRPMNIFVAQFIGTPPMNFLVGAVSSDGAWVEGPGFRLPIPEPLRSSLSSQPSSKVTVGMRPEHVFEGDKAGSSFQVRIELVEPLGEHLVVHGSVGPTSVAFKMDPHRQVRIGESLSVTVATEHLHLFDTQTEKRILPKES